MTLHPHSSVICALDCVLHLSYQYVALTGPTFPGNYKYVCFQTPVFMTIDCVQCIVVTRLAFTFTYFSLLYRR